MRTFTGKEAKELAKSLEINLNEIKLDEFVKGLNVELEHGSTNPETNITHDIDIRTAQIALAHLRHIPDYYTRLDRMMRDGYVHWNPR